jgi:hypothetical protein
MARTFFWHLAQIYRPLSVGLCVYLKHILRALLSHSMDSKCIPLKNVFKKWHIFPNNQSQGDRNTAAGVQTHFGIFL